MTQTVNSGSTSYCSPAQFVTLYDWRPFAQYVVDNDVPASTSAAFQTSTVLAAKLQVAAGMIEAACTLGQRYDPTDLALLVTPVAGQIPNSGWLLIKINAGVAAAEIVDRRLEGLPEAIAEKIKQAQEMLAALEEGTQIFAFIQSQAAGIMSDYQETPVDVANRNLPAYIAKPVFGIRSNQYWPRPGG